MKDKHVKSVVVQWLIPLIVLIIVVCIMLVNFSITNGKKESQEVKDSLLSTAEEYALQFHHKIAVMTAVTESLSAYMEGYGDQIVETAQNAAAVAVENTDAYLVVVCSKTGEGVTHTGEQVELGGLDYFAEAAAESQVYLYSADDGVEGNSCIISAVPIHKGDQITGYMLSYFDTANLENMIKKMEFGTSEYCAVIDGDGRTICETGTNHSIFEKENFWQQPLVYGANAEEVQLAYKRFKSGINDMVIIETQGQGKAVIFSPIEINDWQMTIVMNEDYVRMLERREWINVQRLMLRLVICMFVFLGVIVLINIISRLREVEKRADIAKKADTDLLTGLNNKLATEQKIRSYIEGNPEAQGVLFLLDIDNFKKINDTMGHAFGDEVLRTLGHQIRAEFRASDIIGRIGGDEFMIFLKDMKDDEVIRKEAGKIERFFKGFRAGEYVKYSATASIGAAVFPGDAKDFLGLYKAADKAVYIAKKRGKNQLAYFNAERFENKEEPEQ